MGLRACVRACAYVIRDAAGAVPGAAGLQLTELRRCWKQLGLDVGARMVTAGKTRELGARESVINRAPERRGARGAVIDGRGAGGQSTWMARRVHGTPGEGRRVL